MKIAVEMLKAGRACDHQARLFEKTFGTEAEVTYENCLLAIKVGLDIEWAVTRLLPTSAIAAYHKEATPAYKLYNAAVISAKAAYDEATTPARDAHREALTSYNAAIASALATYNVARARAFFNALNKGLIS